MAAVLVALVWVLGFQVGGSWMILAWGLPSFPSLICCCWFLLLLLDIVHTEGRPPQEGEWQTGKQIDDVLKYDDG